MKYFILLCATIFSIGCSAQLSDKKEAIAIDDSLGIALIQVPKDFYFTESKTLSFGAVSYTIQVGDTLRLVDANKKSYHAYTTTYPIIQIQAPEGIVNEPKRMTQVSYAAGDTIFTAAAGVELRGGSSIKFAKKTYDLNFYTDQTGTENLDVQLAGMRSDDDWILDAIYNEPLRMRSHLGFALWRDIHKPYYRDREPKAKAGITSAFVEVFVNNRYKGIYLLTEQVDRKLLDLKKQEGTVTHGELFQGAMYRGAITFDSITKKNNNFKFWGGYDIKYPDELDTYWDNLYPFTDFVINSKDEDFKAGIASQFELDNFIDYFLFINLLRAPDNLGKNVYVARYDIGEPYFYVPWDLDGTFGSLFSGERSPMTVDFLTNGLLRRLIKTNAADFNNRFRDRWQELRNTHFDEDKLLERQEKWYRIFKEDGVYDREKLIWKDLNDDQEQLEYMQKWTKKRLAFLDMYIGKLGREKE